MGRALRVYQESRGVAGELYRSERPLTWGDQEAAGTFQQQANGRSLWVT
jgi:hypothetical protein